MMMKRIQIALVLAVGLMAAVSAAGQTRMEKAVVAIGGGRTAGTGTRMDYTIGQQVAGRAQSATTVGEFGFWSIASSALSVDPEEGAGIVTALTISPNPASSRSSVEIGLARSGEVEVALYDMTGRKAFDLFTGVRPAGRFTLPLDVTGLASGTYYIAVSTPGAMLQRMVTVVR